MTNQNVRYIRHDFLKVTPSMGIAVQVINAAKVIGGLNNALCSKFDGLREVIAPADSDELMQLGSLVVYDRQYLLLAGIVGQVFPGPATAADTYDARRAALWNGLVHICTVNPGRDLYVPYMLACGQAGDDWAVIEAKLNDLPNTVYVCVPRWAEAAAELLGRLPMGKAPATSELMTDDAYAPMRSFKLAA